MRQSNKRLLLVSELPQPPLIALLQCYALLNLLTIFNPFNRIAAASKNKINPGKPCVFDCNLLIISVF